MNNYSWDTTFTELFERCLKEYSSGNEDYESYYSEADRVFLKSIGCKTREFFDFVEDHADGGGIPSVGTAMMVASVRRDYFDTMMGGELSETEITPDQLPGKPEELAGYKWLPRIIVKARGKLRGELDPDIMYGCGGDRGFLRRHDIAPADFLRAVWAAGDNDDEIVDYVRTHSAG